MDVQFNEDNPTSTFRNAKKREGLAEKIVRHGLVSNTQTANLLLIGFVVALVLVGYFANVLIKPNNANLQLPPSVPGARPEVDGF